MSLHRLFQNFGLPLFKKFLYPRRQPFAGIVSPLSVVAVFRALSSCIGEAWFFAGREEAFSLPLGRGFRFGDAAQFCALSEQ